MEATLNWWKAKAKEVSFKVIWKKGFVLIPFFIWLERNARRYENGKKSVDWCFELVRGEISAQSYVHHGFSISISDLLCYRRLGISGIKCRPRQIFEIFWCPPLSGWWKVNTDGCSLRNPGKAEARGVLCNDKAEVVGNFRFFLGVLTNFEAEFLTVMSGIELAKSLEIPKLWIKCDLVAVVTLLLKKKVPWTVR
ncbi:uncharacterized protein LOC122065045 [Macadamia integrifolia]|uniref:uncharacterized protein LOC122065045 n=1 Tax=Macadamia integrifolia TaxID=60698 RepID=UPI001C4F9E9D|nr:uncharacterized protein LOC122065045 [Macadamia integrifolia]